MAPQGWLQFPNAKKFDMLKIVSCILLMAQKNNTAHEIKEKLVGYITAAFGLVAALAWNDAIKTLIDTLYSAEKNTIIAKFIYAVVITIVVVLVSIYLAKLTKKKASKK